MIYRLAIGMVSCLLLVSTIHPADAQSRRYDDRRSERSYDDRDYRDCQRLAERRSGYRGEVPDRYLPGGALQGAARGSNRAAFGSWIGGGDREERERAKKRGAAIGAIIGGLQRAAARDEQDRRRRDYQYELDNCMRDFN